MRCRLFAMIALTLTVSLSPAGEWPQWRGPSGQGYSNDSQAPLTWGDKQNLLWKTKLPGEGNSTPIVCGNRIFLTASSARGDERHVLCVRASDGTLLWQQLAARDPRPLRTHEWNGHASASCVTDGSHVYAFFGTPGLFCYNLDGKLVWKHSFGIFTNVRGWGIAASPVLFEDLVIQNCDNSAPKGLPPGVKSEEGAVSALVALDKRTGKVRWQTPRDQGFGFSTPVFIPGPDGRPELVLNGPHGVWAYDPQTGKETWHCERHKGEESAMYGEPLPVFDRERLFAASGRPGPFQAIRLGGQGDVTQTHVLWDVNRTRSRDVGSPILWGDTVFIGDRFGYLTAHDAKAGRLRFKERAGSKSFSASPVAVRGKLLFLMEDGTTFVVEPGPKLKVADKNVLRDGTEFRASPAIVDGRIFLRSQSHLYCIGAKE